MKKSILSFLFLAPIFFSFGQETTNYKKATNGCLIYCMDCEDIPIKWTGKCLNGYANGYGNEIIYRDNKTIFLDYKGNLLKGKMSGRGVLIYPNENSKYKFVGEFKNDDYYTGTFYYPSNQIYSVLNENVETLSSFTLAQQIKEKNDSLKKAQFIEKNDFLSFFNISKGRSYEDIKNYFLIKKYKIEEHRSSETLQLFISSALNFFNFQFKIYYGQISNLFFIDFKIKDKNQWDEVKQDILLFENIAYNGSSVSEYIDECFSYNEGVDYLGDSKFKIFLLGDSLKYNFCYHENTTSNMNYGSDRLTVTEFHKINGEFYGGYVHQTVTYGQLKYNKNKFNNPNVKRIPLSQKIKKDEEFNRRYPTSLINSVESWLSSPIGSTSSSNSSSDDKNYENIVAPSYEMTNCKEDAGLLDGKYTECKIKYSDGKKGYIYKGKMSGKCFFETTLMDGNRNEYYKSLESCINALYVYTKYKKVIEKDRTY